MPAFSAVRAEDIRIGGLMTAGIHGGWEPSHLLDPLRIELAGPRCSLSELKLPRGEGHDAFYKELLRSRANQSLNVLKGVSRFFSLRPNEVGGRDRRRPVLGLHAVDEDAFP